MNRSPESHDAMDPLLRGHFGGVPPDAAQDIECLDAETLAAWEERSLTERDRARVEAHAASCARCQALLGAMARTAPVDEAYRPSRLPIWSWLPVTAAAAAAVIWFVVPRTPPPSAPAETTVARQEQSRPPVTVPAPAPEPSARAPEAQSAAPQRAQPEAQSNAIAERARKSAGAAKPADAAATASNAPADLLSADARANERAAPPAAAPVAPLAETITIPAPRREGAPAAPAQPSSNVDAIAGGVTGGAASGRYAARGSIADAAWLSIAAPGSADRWRFPRGAESDSIEHSGDGGATWQRQPLAAAVRLSAGACASPASCWLVGAAGTVLALRDGVWQRVTFPEPADLTAVSLGAGGAVTVHAADGRTFITQNAGATWTSAPLQEFPARSFQG